MLDRQSKLASAIFGCVSLTMCLSLNSCSETATTTTEKATNQQARQSPERITIAQYGHVFLYMPLYVAVDRGFFKEEGLDVNLVSTGGDEKTFTAVSTGNAQFGVSDPTFAAIARSRGQGGKVVAGLVRGVPFWVLSFDEKKKPFKDADGLAGHRVATYTAPSTSYAVMSEILRNDGKPIKATIVQGAFGTLLAMLQANHADLAMEIEPVVSVALEQGGHIVYSPAKVLGDFAFTGLTVSDEYRQQHPETIQKVVNALDKAMDYIRSDFEGSVAIAHKEFPEVKETVVRAALKRLVDQGTIPESPMLDQTAWDRAIQLRKNLGDIKENGSYAENVDMTFVQNLPD